MLFLDLRSVNAQYADELKAAANRVIDSGWYLQGQEVESFEREYAQYVGTLYCVTCGNGLDALTLLLRAYMQMGILHEGDEVIVPANTFLATVLAVTENRLTPVFIEPRPDTLQLDESRLLSHITPRTRAVLLVHLYGTCAYTDRIGDICREQGILLLEDNAQAHGCRYNNRRTGSLGAAAAHSFYPGKNLGALGDAGAVTTDDRGLADTLRSLSCYGFSRKYYADRLGRNSRMDELQAAFLRVKLSHLDADNASRRQIAAIYENKISNPHIRLVRHEAETDCVYHIFTIFCKCRNQLQDYLSSQGVQTLIHYPVPPHLQKCYSQYAHLSLPITEQLAAEELSLPISPVMSIGEAEEVVRIINQFTPDANL